MLVIWLGSPSGHLMVSAAVGYLVLMYAFEHPLMRFVWSFDC